MQELALHFFKTATLCIGEKLHLVPSLPNKLQKSNVVFTLLGDVPVNQSTLPMLLAKETLCQSMQDIGYAQNRTISFPL
jgi:hypothetical protein